jgi:hypothetical protein
MRRFLEKNISPTIPDFFRKVGDLSGGSLQAILTLTLSPKRGSDELALLLLREKRLGDEERKFEAAQSSLFQFCLTSPLGVLFRTKSCESRF